jgi:hypothetical protein
MNEKPFRGFVNPQMATDSTTRGHLLLLLVLLLFLSFAIECREQEHEHE